MIKKTLQITLITILSFGGLLGRELPFFFERFAFPEKPPFLYDRLSPGLDALCESLDITRLGGIGGNSDYDGTCGLGDIFIAAQGYPPNKSVDKQYSLYRYVCGDGEVSMQVKNMNNGFAGVEIREDHSLGSVKVGVRTRLNNKIFRSSRIDEDINAVNSNASRPNQTWFKVQRIGSTIKCFTSADGTNWEFYYEVNNLSLYSCVQAGVYVQGRGSNNPNGEATMDNLVFSGFNDPDCNEPELELTQQNFNVVPGQSVNICVDQINPLPCFPATVDLAVTDGFPHFSNYTTQTINFEPGESQSCFTLDVGGDSSGKTYAFNLVNSTGADIGSASQLTITVEAQLDACFSAAEAISICAGESVQIGCPPDADASIVYEWLPNTGFVDSGGSTQANPLVLPQNNTVYTMSVRDGGGVLLAEKVVTINVDELPVVAISPEPAELTTGDNLVLSALVGGGTSFSYLWNTGETGASITVVEGGAVSVTVTNQDGCRAEANIVVEEVDPGDNGEVPLLETVDLEDIVFIGFDNDIGGDNDRIILTNLVTLSNGTEFSLSNARYCALTEEWYSLTGNDGNIAKQTITYIGETALPIGTVMCLDLPASGDYLATNFMLDGVVSNDFSVENTGRSTLPDLNLSTVANNSHLFLMRGDFNYFPSYASLQAGAQIISGIQLGACWDDGNCSVGSGLPEDLICPSSPCTPLNGSRYAYFDCGDFGDNFSRESFLDYAADISNWDIQAGTPSLDFSASACVLDCEIVIESLYWTTHPTDLYINCSQDYQTLIEDWLALNGNGLAAGSCTGNITITNNYLGGNDIACTDTGLEVQFIAEDDCGNKSVCKAMIFIDRDETPVLVAAQDQIVDCGGYTSVSNQLKAWIDQHGGASILNSCGPVEWSYLYHVGGIFSNTCGSTTITFTATTICGDELSTTATFTVVDNVSPTIVSPAAPITLNCSDVSFGTDLDNWLQSKGGAIAEDNCGDSNQIKWGIPNYFHSGGCSNTLITFTAEDVCGNVSTTSAFLNIIDPTPPEIEIDAHDLYVYPGQGNVGNTINAWLQVQGGARAFDICSPDANLTWSDDYLGTLDTTSCDSSIVTFTVQDLCGNENTSTAYVHTVDIVAPTFNPVLQDLEISCTLSEEDFIQQIDNWTAANANSGATDPIQNGLSWTYEILTSIEKECGEYPVEFIVSDGCGNSRDTTVFIRVSDDEAPLFTVLPQNICIDYGDEELNDKLITWLQVNRGGATATDNCMAIDDLVWTTSGLDELPVGNCLEIPVTFTVSDGCNTSSAVTYVVIHTPGITVTSEGQDLDLTNCDGSGQLLTWLNGNAGADITTVCDNLGWTNDYQEGGSVDCSTQVVTFTATNACGETHSFDRIINRADATPPDFISPPTALDITSCVIPIEDQIQTWLTANGGANIVDNCLEAITVINNYSGLTGSCGSATVTFTATDACGNSASADALISIIEAVNPTINTAAQDLDIPLNDPDFNGTISTWLNNNANAQATDNCSNTADLTWSHDYDFSLTATDCASVLVTFTATDECGNSSTTQASINNADGSAPYFTTVPQDLPLLCEANDPIGPITTWITANGGGFAADSGGASLSWDNDWDGSVPSICSSLDVVFTVTDDCGNTVSHTANISLNDTQAPSTTPAQDLDIVVGASGFNGAITTWLNNHGDAIGSDNCTAEANLTWSHDYDFSLSASNCASASVTFTLTDECGNEQTTQANINVAPAAVLDIDEFSSQPLDISCHASDFWNQITTWLDAHAGATASGSGLSWDYNWGGLPEPSCGSAPVTFTVMDACGNTASIIEYINVVDLVAPSITTSASDLEVELTDPAFNFTISTWLNNQGGAAAVDGCVGDGTVTWTHDYDFSISTTSCEEVLVTFTATDECDNTSTSQATLSTIDNTIPTFTTLPSDLTVNCDAADFTAIVDAWLAANGNAVATDQVQATLTYDYTLSKSPVPFCSTTPVTFTVSDECGNTVSETANINVVDTSFPTMTSAAEDLILSNDDPLLETKIQDWLNNQGGASATDDCQTNLNWTASPSTVLATPCTTTPVTFTVDDGCNTANTTASVIIQEAGINVVDEGADLSLNCCFFTLTDIQYWLDHHANANILSNCGDFLSWTYTGYDPATINDCNPQSITFTGTNILGETHAFTRQIVFSENGSATLAIAFTNEVKVVRASLADCDSPSFTWKKDNVVINETLYEVRYDLYGPGTYEVTVNCNTYCTATATATFCDDFPLSVDCASNQLTASTTFTCNEGLSYAWYKDGQQLAATSTSITPDEFGTYTLVADCAGNCSSSADVIVDCADLSLLIANDGSSVWVQQVAGCMPANPVYTWSVNGEELVGVTGSSISYNGSGIYAVSVAWLGSTCSPTIAPSDICIPVQPTINRIENTLFAASSACAGFPVFTWYLLGNSNPVATGPVYTPTQTGTYTVKADCQTGCFATSANYAWAPLCESDIFIYAPNTAELCAEVSGPSCSGGNEQYTWFREGVQVYQSASNCYFPSQSGDYTVTATCTDAEGNVCPATSAVYEFVEPCSFGSTSLSQVGDFLVASTSSSECNSATKTYYWYRNDELYSQTSSASITPDRGGSYKVVIQCGDGSPNICQVSTNTVNYQVNCDGSISIYPASNELRISYSGVDCGGAGAFTSNIQWYYEGLPIPGATNTTYIPTQNGTYSVSLECQNGGPVCEVSDSHEVLSFCDASVSIAQTHGTFCANVSGSICDGAAITYTWRKDGSIVHTSSTSNCYVPVGAGSYTVTIDCVNGGNSCSATSSVPVDHDLDCDLGVTINKYGSQLCAATSGDYCAGELKQYIWFLDGNQVSGPNFSGCYTPTQNGIYTVSVSCTAGGDDCVAMSLSYQWGDPCAAQIIEIREGILSCANGIDQCIIPLYVDASKYCSTPDYSWVAITGKIEAPSISTDAAIYATPGGTYQVFVNDDCGGNPCQYTATIELSDDGNRVVQEPAAFNTINKAPSLIDINIFPNPTRGEVFIEINTATDQPLQLEFFDASGRRVLSDSAPLQRGVNQFKYQLQQFASGVYFVRMQTQEGRYFRKLTVVRD